MGFVGCPAGWGCQLINNQLFKAFDMEAKGWKLIDPGSAAGLDGSIAKASDSGEPWFGYNWNNCITLAEQDCASPKPTAWTKSEVNSIVSANFAKTGGKDVLSYVEKRTYPGTVMNG